LQAMLKILITSTGMPKEAAFVDVVSQLLRIWEMPQDCSKLNQI